RPAAARPGVGCRTRGCRRGGDEGRNAPADRAGCEARHLRRTHLRERRGTLLGQRQTRRSARVAPRARERGAMRRSRLMRGMILGAVLAAALVAPRPSAAWVRGGFGIVYGGPYPFGYAWPPAVAYYPPAYYPPPVAPYYPPPVYVAPPAYWPSYGPDIAV